MADLRRWNRLLLYAGWVLGLGVIGYGLWRFFIERSIPGLLISLSVLIVGPLEDILKRRVRRTSPIAEEPAVELVDLATSAAFLVLLLITIYLLP